MQSEEVIQVLQFVPAKCRENKAKHILTVRTNFMVDGYTPMFLFILKGKQVSWNPVCFPERRSLS